MGLRRPLAGALAEHECPRCHGEVELPLGELCGECSSHIRRRAARVARVAAMVSTALMALYIFIPLPADERGRAIGAMAVIMWYVLSYLIVRRTMQHWEH